MTKNTGRVKGIFEIHDTIGLLIVLEPEFSDQDQDFQIGDEVTVSAE